MLINRNNKNLKLVHGIDKKNAMINKTKVSIVCITYNHERFIKQALDSFIMQKVNFDLEVIIGEDCSTDNTRVIIGEYEKKYPNIVKPIYRDKNVGMMQNFVDVLYRATGEYIALCEGDDYWTDLLKLQKQIDFLDSNPDYVISYHDTIQVDANGIAINLGYLSNDAKRDFTSEELIKGAWCHTLTRCFRNVLKNFPEELFQVYNADTFITSLLGNFGKGKYMTDIAPAAYRKHPASIWSSLDESIKMFRSGSTRAWLHRYYKRIRQDIYADYFKKLAINYFARALENAVSAGGHQRQDIINNIFTQFSDIIDSSSENKLHELESYCRCFNNINPGMENINVSSPNNTSGQPLEARNSDDKSLDFWLNKKSWQYKKKRYADCFKSATFLRRIESPVISIIVISWRLHPDNIKSFEILEKQRGDNFELIFVDNGGKEGEFNALKPYINTYVKLNTNTGAYLARNIGSFFAQAPILLFLEDDGIPEHNLVRAHLDLFEKYDIIACRGAYIPKTDNPMNKMQDHYYIGDKEYPTFAIVEGNTSYRAEQFFQVGGWDDEIRFGGGGLELYFRLLTIEPDKRKQIYSPLPIIYHDYARDEEHLKEKRRKQEMSFARLREKYPQWDEVGSNYRMNSDRGDLLIKKSNS